MIGRWLCIDSLISVCPRLQVYVSHLVSSVFPSLSARTLLGPYLDMPPPPHPCLPLSQPLHHPRLAFCHHSSLLTCQRCRSADPGRRSFCFFTGRIGLTRGCTSLVFLKTTVIPHSIVDITSSCSDDLLHYIYHSRVRWCIGTARSACSILARAIILLRWILFFLLSCCYLLEFRDMGMGEA